MAGSSPRIGIVGLDPPPKLLKADRIYELQKPHAGLGAGPVDLPDPPYEGEDLLPADEVA